MNFQQRLYDLLFDMGVTILQHRDPCKISSDGKTCAGGTPCCTGCRHLGPKGCRVKALACKLWLCHAVTWEKDTPPGQNRQIVAVIELRALKEAGYKAGLPMGYRKSKAENFGLLRRGVRPMDWHTEQV